MNRNTVDIIFLGSSHGVAAFSPQELYNNFGLRSYNLACEQQNLATSYYWLKESLRYQSPKVIVLDTRMCFDFFENESLNTSEECTRKAFDYMKWAKVKIDAINDLCSHDKSYVKSSFYLPTIRYHERWKELSLKDFLKWDGHYEMKGQSFMHWHTVPNTFQPFDIMDRSNVCDMNSLMEEYLQKIVYLCKKENISLCLVKTPCFSSTEEMYNTIMKFAKKCDLHYIDFNEKSVYEECNYNLGIDNADTDHVLPDGASKVTSYIGKFICNNYDVDATVDSQWEITKQYYESKKNK